MILQIIANQNIFTVQHNDSYSIYIQNFEQHKKLSTENILTEELDNNIEKLNNNLISQNNEINVNNDVSISQEQKMRVPTEEDDESYIDMYTFHQLNKLMKKRYCNNFIDSQSSKHDYETLMTWWERSEIYCDVDELKEIVFQVLWGLMVAQKECSFYHQALDFDNIMIKKSRTPNYYVLTNKTNSEERKTWCCRKVEVKICSFESSLIDYIDEETNEIVLKVDTTIIQDTLDRNRFAELLLGIYDSSHIEEEKERELFDELIESLSSIWTMDIDWKELFDLNFFKSMIPINSYPVMHLFYNCSNRP